MSDDVFWDVFARAGCHGNDPEIKKQWIWMGTHKAEAPEVAARAVFDDIKARWPGEWAAWTLDDFRATKHVGGSFGEPVLTVRQETSS